MGNITKDIEIKHTPSGTAVANFSVAVNRKIKQADGSYKDAVDFIRVTAWGKTAEVIGGHLGKGSPIFVEGRLQVRQWESEDGKKNTATEVICERMQFLGGKKKEDKDDAGAPADAGDQEQAPF